MEHAAETEETETATTTPRWGSNQSGMRAHNERLVLTLIRETGALAKAEIARRTGLSAQTVSVIMRALEADGLLKRGEPVRGKIGQPSVPMSLAKNGAFFFGLTVGRRNLDLVLINFLGEVRHRVRLSHPFPTPDNTARFAKDAIGEILNRLPHKDRRRVAGLGIALPFRLWDWADMFGIDASEMDDWKERDIGAEIGADWDFPVFVSNDASAACGAELVFGDQFKPRDFLYFFVGFFIGGGLVLDGALYTGPTGNAAALGSLMVPTPDRTLHQLVDVASLANLEQALASRGDAHAMVWDAPDSWDLPMEPLEDWLATASHGIAHAIFSSVCLVDIRHVLIDGWMPAALRAQLVQRVQANVLEMTAQGVQKPDVFEGSIGFGARALGAASLPLSQRFLIDRNSYLKGPSK